MKPQAGGWYGAHITGTAEEARAGQTATEEARPDLEVDPHEAFIAFIAP
jgi:hypothetical protein